MSTEPEVTTNTDDMPQFDRLKFRRNLSLGFIGLGIVPWTIAYLGGQLANIRGIEVAIPVFVVTFLAQGIVLMYFARKSGNPDWWLIAPLAFLPVMRLFAYLIVAGYESAPKETKKRPLPVFVWMAVGLSPCLLWAALLLYRPQFMGILFVGPPDGASATVLGIPCGWLIVAVLLALIGSNNLSLWLGVERIRLSRGGMISILVFGVMTLTIPACWLVVFGPASVLIYAQYFGYP